MGLILNMDNVPLSGNRPHDGEVSAGVRERDVFTLFGHVSVTGRHYYYNAGKDTGRFPADDALCLINGSTPALATRAIEYALKESYAKASVSFGRAYTKEMTPDILKGLVKTAGKSAGEFFGKDSVTANRAHAKSALHTADKNAASCVVVLADGTGMPMRSEELRGVKGRADDGTATTREVKVGATCEIIPAPGKPEERVRVAGSTTYIATLERKPEFADMLRAEFDRCYSILPEEVLLIGDGAKWIWEMRRTHFPFAVEILDFFHATEHLAPLLDLLGLPEKERKNTFRKWKRWLKDGKVGKLIQVCEKSATNTADDKAKQWNAALGYYKDNRDRMKYDSYIAKGWYYGSGIVESACKEIVEARFKRAGMRWSRKGADALLPFRTAHLSNRYEELWNFIINKRKLVHAA